MAQDPVCRFLEALGIPGAQQRVQQNVIRLERRIGFEFAAPVPIFVLLREKILARRRDRRVTRLASSSILPKRS